MTEMLRTALSALVDQEASEFETRRALEALKSNPDLKARFGAYQSIGATLRGESLVPESLLTRIHAALDAPEQPASQARPAATQSPESANPTITFLPAREALPSRFGIFAGQLAMAASIAFAVVIGVKVVAPVEMKPPAVTSVETPEIIRFQLPVQREQVAVQTGVTAVDESPEASAPRLMSEADVRRLVSERLGQYLVRHAENSSVVGTQSVLPLARIMGRDEPIQ
jgi:sigma-E factor negative regulatory protein RseA